MSSSVSASTAYHRPREVHARQCISRIVIVEYWLPLLVWVAITHLFSTDAFSSGESSRIIVPILKFLFPEISPEGIESWHTVVRKAGHVTEYFVLGMLAYRMFHYAEASAVRAKAVTIAFVLVAAMSDEAHQLLTASRTGSLVDVAYDLVGGVLATWVLASMKRCAVIDRAYSKGTSDCRGGL